MASAIPGSLKQTMQGIPYGSPPSKDLFRVASFEYQQQREVSPTYVADLLSRAASMITSITFTFSIIDKPQGGQIYLISLPPNAVEIPSDGYIYLDSETTSKIALPDGRELLCMERLQGFAPGDQVISRVRRRYRFANDHQDLQLLHYSLPDGRQQQIVPPPYTRHPTQSRYPMGPMAMQASMNPYGRPPNAISPMAIQSPGPSSMHTPPAALARGPAIGTPTPMGNSYVQFQTRVPGSGNQRGPQPGMPQTPTKPTGRRTKGTKNKATAAAVAAAAEEIDEPSGDEIDNLKFREVAMSRFKRNHDYISEIFSAYSISSISPPTSIYVEKKKDIDELKQQLATYQADIEKLKSKHSEKVEEFKRHSNVLSKSMDDLSKCNTTEELLKLQERTEKELDIVIQLHNPVKLIQMRDGPESDVEVEGHNDFMQEDVIGEELLNSEHEGLVELDQGLSPYDIRKDLVNTSEIHDTPGIEELEGLKDIQGIEGIEGIEGMGGIDTSQGYFSPANMPGLTNDPNLQLDGLTGNPNIEDHPNYSGLTITNYGGDSSQMFNEFINAPDDEVPLS